MPCSLVSKQELSEAQATIETELRRSDSPRTTTDAAARARSRSLNISSIWNHLVSIGRELVGRTFPAAIFLPFWGGTNGHRDQAG